MGIPHNKYEPEFRMMVARKVVHDGMTGKDAAELFHIKGHQRPDEWAKRYVETGNPDWLTGEKTKSEIKRDKPLWKAARYMYLADKLKAEANALSPQIEAEKTKRFD